MTNLKAIYAMRKSKSVCEKHGVRIPRYISPLLLFAVPWQIDSELRALPMCVTSAALRHSLRPDLAFREHFDKRSYEVKSRSTAAYRWALVAPIQHCQHSSYTPTLSRSLWPRLVGTTYRVRVSSKINVRLGSHTTFRSRRLLVIIQHCTFQQRHFDLAYASRQHLN
jgi:hypothetical protein